MGTVVSTPKLARDRLEPAASLLAGAISFQTSPETPGKRLVKQAQPKGVVSCGFSESKNR